MPNFYITRNGFKEKFLKEQEGSEFNCSFVLQQDVIIVLQLQAQLVRVPEDSMFRPDCYDRNNS